MYIYIYTYSIHIHTICSIYIYTPIICIYIYIYRAKYHANEDNNYNWIEHVQVKRRSSLAFASWCSASAILAPWQISTTGATKARQLKTIRSWFLGAQIISLRRNIELLSIEKPLVQAGSVSGHDSHSIHSIHINQPHAETMVNIE